MLFRLLPVPLCVMHNAHTQMEPLVKMDQSAEPLHYVRGVVTFGPIRGLPHTHTLRGTLRGSLLQGEDTVSWLTGVGSARRQNTAELSLGTHTNSQPGCGCVCVCSGWFRAGFRCVSLSRRRPLGSQGGAPTSRVGQRVNTHTIQRC